MVVDSANHYFSVVGSNDCLCTSFANGSVCVRIVLKIMKKKIILFIVVLLELAGGVLIIFGYYGYSKTKTLTSEQKVAIINKDKLIFPETDGFKYYFELQSNTISFDQPTWLPKKATYRFNNDGLNDSYDYLIEKPANTFRIIALGDSFTYGHYVDTDSNWTELLERMLNKSNSCNYQKIEVLNLGMPGFDVPYLVKRYQDFGLKYNPDMVIWFESGSGFYRLNELMRPEIDSCTLRLEGDQSSKKTELIEEIGYFCWNEAQEKIMKENSVEDISQLIFKHLDDFVNENTNLNIDLLFFTLNSSGFDDRQIKSLSLWKDRYQEITFFEIEKINDLRGFLPDGHPNPNGHHHIAKEIFEYLKENTLNECL